MTDREGPIKVAVLGGGVAGITAAFELTAPELEGRYEVTVYQPGWRLGGKCASGRRGPENRIEEHGLHVWFGFYANAFDLIQRCYEEWDPGPDSPFQGWQDAFSKCNDIVLFEKWDGHWTPWHLELPPDELTPGTRDELTVWELLHRVLKVLLEQWESVRERHGDAIPFEAAQSGRELHLALVDHLAAEIHQRAQELDRQAGTHLLQLAARVAASHVAACDEQPHPHLADIESLLTAFNGWLFEEALEHLVESPVARRFAIFLDVCVTSITGMLADGVFEHGFGVINDIDLWKWLEKHGVRPLTLEHASFIEGLYDLVFAYEEGDHSVPNLAAGKALQAMMRIGTEYKGAVLWKMQAGMGDTVFSPLYDVLSARGARFRFFHSVTKLGVSEDGAAVSTIEVQPQAHPAEAPYDPIVSVDGLRCWPCEPKWDLLCEGAQLERAGVDLEHDLNPLGLDPITLRAGEDFDEVVLAIPVGALPPICGELAAANARFEQMLDSSSTVMTQGIQLWLAELASELGWPFESSIATSYVARADTYSNMAHLLKRETWAASSAPRDVVYLCGVLDHAGISTQADADLRVRENVLVFLEENARPLWPRAMDDSRDGFDWSQLADPNGASGPARLDSQLLRANFLPTERYVMTRAGSVSARLGADESGFANLKLAGDWTRNGIDGGAVEAAVTSGMQAARAISGRPERIEGEHGWLVDD
jgi:uncharacterized protein with NAD-binding domain and iron-sulfur cluster